MSKKYKPVSIEAVMPDGTVMIRNAFRDENSAVQGLDPAWPREKLIELANLWASRWNETYGWNAVILRVAK